MIRGTPTKDQVEQELRAIDLLAHESGWDQPPALLILHGIPVLDDPDIMELRSVKVNRDGGFWGAMGGGDVVTGLYMFARALMDSIMGLLQFPEEVLDPLVAQLPVGAVFLNENWAIDPGSRKLLKEGERFDSLPPGLRKEQRSLHGIDNQGQIFHLNHVRGSEHTEESIVFEHQADMEPGVRGLGRLPISLKMVQDALEAHFVMIHREERPDDESTQPVG